MLSWLAQLISTNVFSWIIIHSDVSPSVVLSTGSTSTSSPPIMKFKLNVPIVYYEEYVYNESQRVQLKYVISITSINILLSIWFILDYILLYIMDYWDF